MFSAYCMYIVLCIKHKPNTSLFQIMAALVYGMFICPFMSCRPDISLDELVAFQSMCM